VRARREEPLGADRALVVDERHRSHLEPGVADQPEPRRTREQPTEVFPVLLAVDQGWAKVRVFGFAQ
jgi:hypothetical protein